MGGITHIIETKELTKRFKDVLAVDRLSMRVRRGEIYGFLGPNGAGKTTTIKMILGLIHPTSGEVYIKGQRMHPDNVSIKQEIGYLPERVSFYENLTPTQTLEFFCELKGADKAVVPELISDVGLEEVANRRVGTFSKGMVQILGFAQAMIGSPSIYILDEPSSGLDARWVKVVRDRIRALNSAGATVVFSSHILSEVQALCDRVCVINKGRLVAEDSIDNLSRKLHIRPKLIVKVRNRKGITKGDIEAIDGVERAELRDNYLHITCEGEKKLDIIEAIRAMGVDIEDFSTVEPSLEDTFIKLLEGEQ